MDPRFNIFDAVLDHPVLVLGSIGLLAVVFLFVALRRMKANPKLFVYAIVGVYAFVIPIQLFFFFGKHYRQSQLEKHGVKIVATITGVRINTHLRMNHRSPWLMDAQWTDPQSHQIYSFVSRSIGFDPRPRLAGSTIPVLIDPANPHHYVMDLSPLYATKPRDVYQELRDTQKEVQTLKQEIESLKKNAH